MAKKILTGLLSGDPRFLFESACLTFQAPEAESLPLRENTYVVIDLETTGANPAARDRITELAFIKVRGGRIVDEFVSLVNPEVPVPPFISNLTGITDAMVCSAPTFETLAGKAMEFLGNAVLVAHNAKFDTRFLDAEFDRTISAGLGLPHVCTLQTARQIIRGLPNYRLQTVAAHYNVEIEGRHRAAGDARATARIWIKMLETMERYGVPSLSVARGFKLYPEHSIL